MNAFWRNKIQATHDLHRPIYIAVRRLSSLRPSRAFREINIAAVRWSFFATLLRGNYESKTFVVLELTSSPVKSEVGSTTLLLYGRVKTWPVSDNSCIIVIVVAIAKSVRLSGDERRFSCHNAQLPAY